MSAGSKSAAACNAAAAAPASKPMDLHDHGKALAGHGAGLKDHGASLKNHGAALGAVAAASAGGASMLFAPGAAAAAASGLVAHEVAHVVQQREGRVSPHAAKG